MVLAPRHPERFDSVEGLCRNAGFRLRRRTRDEACVPGTQIFLLDTMGELPIYYGASDIAIVGGSLLPYGGHNVLEPASLGIPVITGLHTFNFEEVVSILTSVGAVAKVADETELSTQVKVWLDDSNERDRIGQLAKATINEHTGATDRTMSEIQNLLANADKTSSAAAEF